ncbi:hypothetical protein [Anaplasma bovis]|uniref:hypothetical protein n=1 Tax=Anaplasma bovis TaxID=186733 RepID=UPI002FEE8909
MRKYLLCGAVMLTYLTGSSAIGDCVGLVYSLMDCTPYKCVAQFSEHEIEYEILGSFKDKYCRYSEKDKSGFTLCDISDEDFGATSNYLMQLLTRNSNSIEHDDVTRLKAKTCRFYRTLGNSFVKKGMRLDEQDVKKIERIVESRIRREEVNGLRSMLFDDEEL